MVPTAAPSACTPAAQDWPAGAAAAQDDAYTPRNIRLGSFLLQPQITLAETFNDNIFYTEDDEESDFITNVLPSLRLRSNWSRHALNAFAYYDAESPRAGETDFVVAKNRDGEKGTVTVASQLHLSRFVDFSINRTEDAA